MNTSLAEFAQQETHQASVASQDLLRVVDVSA